MDILPFNFEDNQIRTLKDEKGDIWFNAKDTLIVLQANKKPDISNGTKDLDEDEKRRFKIVSGEQTRQMTFVSESGLYSLILRSRKPVAKPFQKWITREVLPEIRKTGKYELSQNSQQSQSVQTSQNFDLDSYISENEKLIKLIKIITSENPMTLHYLDKLTKKLNLKSPLDLLEIDLNSYYFIPTELGKFFNKSAVEINKILEAKGFQVKVNGVWKLTKQGEKYAIQLDNNYKTIKWKLESLI
jgi:prophage antirepressor-like protein